MKIVAHRGGPINEPENTLRAFKQAIEEGADAIECDVCLTRDDEPVIVHIDYYNNYISRLVGQPAKLKNLYWADLIKLDVKGEPFLHFSGLINFARENSIHCFLELKRESKLLREKVMQAICQNNLSDKFTLLEFYYRRRILIECKKANKNLKTSVIFLNPFGDWIGRAKKSQADIIILGWNKYKHMRLLGLFVNLKEKIKQAHAQGIEVYGGWADDKSDIKWFEDLGGDGIFTNNVALASKILNQK